MIKFFHKTKVFERPIKLTKNMLSPHKNRRKATIKRKLPDESDENSPENKKKKYNQLEKYYPIIID